MDSQTFAIVRVCGMRKGISFTVTADDRRRLVAIVADRCAPQKHVWRARIVLFSGDGLGTSAIMAAAGKSKTCVWRWPLADRVFACKPREAGTLYARRRGGVAAR